MCTKIVYFAIFSFIFTKVSSVPSACAIVDVRILMEGCDHLLGLNITTIGGTSVNDHNCDVLLPKQIFIEEPTYEYEMADSNKFYTLLILDPDAPPQIDGEFYLHLLKANIPGHALNNMDKKTNYGNDFRAYKTPAPSRGSGPHRYMNLLYEQADGNKFLPTLPQSRNRFHIANWLRGKNLCGPVAATQFRLEF